MPPTEAIHTGMGFDEAGCWHQAKVLYMPARRSDGDLLAPARGAIYGLLASGALWALILGAVHILHKLL
jgi:hypothetical protein